MRLSIPVIIVLIVVVAAIWTGVYYLINTNVGTAPQTTTPTTTPTQTQTITTTSPLQVYSAAIADHASRASDAITSLGELVSQPQFDDSSWKSAVETQITLVKSLYQEAVQISAPVEVVAIHTTYLQAMALYEAAAGTIAQAIETADINPINQAIAEINAGTQLINQAIAELNELNLEQS